MTSNTRLTNKLHKFTDNLALLSHVSTERTKLYVKYFPLCFFHWPRKDIFSTSFSPFLFFQSLLSRCYSLCCRKIFSFSLSMLFSRAFPTRTFSRAFNSLCSSVIARCHAFLSILDILRVFRLLSRKGQSSSDFDDHVAGDATTWHDFNVDLANIAVELKVKLRIEESAVDSWQWEQVHFLMNLPVFVFVTDDHQDSVYFRHIQSIQSKM